MPAIRVPAGRPALVALRDAVVAAKGDDPLAPVTVAVPTSYAGLSLRRLLAAGDLDPTPGSAGGLVNVRFLVGARIAELLGASVLAAQGRRPLSRAIRAEAVRAALTADPGGFRSVADHPTTERALDRLFVELRPCDEASLQRLAGQSGRAADVVSLYRSTRTLLHDWYDEHDLASAATCAVQDGSPALADLGRLVVFRSQLPEAPPPTDITATLVAALGDRATEVVAILDGSSTATSLISVPDADEESRTIAREVVARVRTGVPLHRMAIAYPTAQPYSALLDQHLEAAGIPRNGPPVRTLAQTVTGRALLGLLDLAEHGLQRDALIGWLTGAPVLDPVDGRPVTTSAWDTESRQAGVVGGPAQWQDRLHRHLTALGRQQKELADQAAVDADTAARRSARLDGRIASVQRLRRFVAELDGALDGSELHSWAELARWARGLLETYLGTASTHRRWPEAEQQSWDSVLDVVDRLSVLDGLGATPDTSTFRLTVQRELEGPAGRVGTFGDGVFVAPLGLLTGVDVDVVFVAGMVEGLLPGASRQDALLPDHERAAAGGTLATGGRGIEEQRGDYLSALAAATTERVLLAPRADLGRNREHLPSRWLLTAAADLAGSEELVSGDDLIALAGDGSPIRFVPSFLAASTGATEPASRQDRTLADLARWTAQGHPAGSHPVARHDARLRAGLAAEVARRSDQFTAFDGRVTAVSIGPPTTDAPLSATSLERYAGCPRRYLLTRLDVRAVERPEEIDAISATERGTVVHAILQEYIESVLEKGPRTLDNLMTIARARLDGAERDGTTGRPLRWRYDRELIERELRRFYVEDEHEPLAAELEFGKAGQPSAGIALPTGTLSFHGSVDRVDRTSEGEIVVTDYKTGSPSTFRAIADDPVVRGTKLQLPIYGLAARSGFGRPGTPVSARYWFVSERGGFEKMAVPLDDATLSRFTEVVAVAVEGITAGSFPAHPGETVSWPTETWKNCKHCEFDRLCPTDRGRHWERKRHAPEVEPYRAMAEGDSR